jgi:hypothetical protein
MEHSKIFFILIAFSGTAIAEQPQFKSQDALQASKVYEKRVKEADIQYFRDLQAAQILAMMECDLEEANLIQKQLDDIKIRYVLLKHNKPIEVTVNADDSNSMPRATGIILKKGQMFSIDPNRNDTWSGRGTKDGVFCGYMGYDDRGNKWMRMMFRVGDGQGIPVEAGKVQTAQQDGELLLYALDDRPEGNIGKIRVSVVVSPE